MLGGGRVDGRTEGKGRRGVYGRYQWRVPGAPLKGPTTSTVTQPP